MTSVLMEKKTDQITVTFTDTNMVQIRSTTDRGKSVKTVSFEAYCEAIIAAQRKEENYGDEVDTPIFPQNPSVSTIQMRQLTTGAEWYFITREAGPLDLQYHDTAFKQVGIPKLLFAVKLSKNVVQRVAVMATLDRTITEDSKLYNYPFSNVSGETGIICFGGNRLHDYSFDSSLQLHSMPNMFLSMPNNDDNYGTRNESKLAFRPLLEQIEGKDFPTEWLKASKLTYGEWRDKFH